MDITRGAGRETSVRQAPPAAFADSGAGSERRRRRVALVWEQFGAYHIDRLEALGRGLPEVDVIGIEIASRSQSYAWEERPGARGWERHTLFPGEVADEVSWPRKLAALVGAVRRTGATDVFLSNLEFRNKESLILLLLAKASGRRVYAMLDGKFDDHPRRVGVESLKPFVLRLFDGALLAGERALAYYRFLGAPEGWGRLAYDTVCVERIRRAAGGLACEAGVSHGDRPFVAVARFLPKKNLQAALRGYAEFLRLEPGSGRKLLLCGSGPLEPELRALAGSLGLEGRVVFTGFLRAEEVAQTMARSLALLLPSSEEQWGLVVNEAVALGLPVICSTNVGARDALVRNGVNGFVVEPENTAGLGFFMHQLSSDAALWTRFSRASEAFADFADVRHTVDGLRALLARAGAAGAAGVEHPANPAGPARPEAIGPLAGAAGRCARSGEA